MTKQMRIFEQGMEEYPRRGIVVGNLILLFWIASGTIACWFLYPPVAWIYLAFALLMVYVVLRKLLCTNCYYYDKRCPIGWGKLSALLFKKGEIERFNTSPGQRIAPLTYGLLTVVPVILVVVSIVREFAPLKILVLVLLLLIGFYSGTVSRKKTCAKCKMKLSCKGSAVK